jgi:hypothetical protein
MQRIYEEDAEGYQEADPYEQEFQALLEEFRE